VHKLHKVIREQQQKIKITSKMKLGTDKIREMFTINQVRTGYLLASYVKLYIL